MKDKDQKLDESLERLLRGEVACDGAGAEAERMLETAGRVKAAMDYKPDPERQAAALKRFNVAREEMARQKKEKQTRTRPWFGWLTLAGAAAVLALIAFQARPFGEAPVIMANADPAGNMIFRLSDDENSIGDFNSLRMTIERVGLLKEDGSAWVGFEPDGEQVELTQLKGDLSQVVWRGDVPPGQYRRVFIEVSRVEGVLSTDGSSLELPDSRLIMDYLFEVTADGVTTFTYDLAVKSKGPGRGYNLEPQAGESGARHQYGQDGQPQEPGEGAGYLPQEGPGGASRDPAIAEVPREPGQGGAGNETAPGGQNGKEPEATGGLSGVGSGDTGQGGGMQSGGQNTESPQQGENKPDVSGSGEGQGGTPANQPDNGNPGTGQGEGGENAAGQGQQSGNGSETNPGSGQGNAGGGEGEPENPTAVTGNGGQGGDSGGAPEGKPDRGN